MKRRQFLALGAAAGALGACGGSSVSMSFGPGMTGGAGASGIPSGLSFVAPPAANAIRTGNLVEITLTAAPAVVALGNDVSPEFWAYNGSIPGPTIDVNEGDQVRVTFRNRLALASTIHWHGLPVPADQDGNPMDPVAPGTDRVYEFTLPAGCAGTYWYHPHTHGTTAEQVFRGLAGLFIVRAADDPLPRAAFSDVPIVVTDLRLDRSGRIAASTPADAIDGRIGDLPLVNGRRAPRLRIAAGEWQRWRVLNATNARYLRLSLAGQTLTLAGTDGGLLAAPVPGLDELLLAPAERAEILVRSDAAPGTVRSLEALPYGGGMMMGGGMGTPAATLLTLETVAGTGGGVALPAQLRALAALPPDSATRRFVLSGDGMMVPFTINARTFLMGRIDVQARQGEVQRWDIVNASAMDHPFHVHGTQFQVVSRRGVPEPRLAWKDTVNVRPGETVVLRIRQDLPGLRMFHCHILEHEDAGMMGVLSVG